MNKKKLPRAIQRTRDDRATGFIEELPQRPASSGTSELRDIRATNVSEPAGKVVKLIPESDGSPRQSPHSSSQTSSLASIGADQRKARALAIVDRHAAYSAIGGVIPLPLANFAGVTAVILRMVKVLSNHYGVPFERDRARTIVVALVGGTMPMGVATLATSTVWYIVPPAALMGLAASCLTAAGFTRSIGRIFVEHFETGATLKDFSAPEPR
jgi:uncharacterized protein (DUF697 family)